MAATAAIRQDDGEGEAVVDDEVKSGSVVAVLSKLKAVDEVTLEMAGVAANVELDDADELPKVPIEFSELLGDDDPLACCLPFVDIEVASPPAGLSSTMKPFSVTVALLSLESYSTKMRRW